VQKNGFKVTIFILISINMRKPFQMYSKVNSLKIIQLKAPKTNIKGALYTDFVGVINGNLETGVIISSKINRLRKDGMSFKYFRNNYIASKDFGKLCKQPLAVEYKFSGHQLIAKKFIKSYYKV
jgi:hypothetical protein